MPLGDWTSRTECLDDIVEGYDWAQINYDNAVDQQSSIVAAIAAISDSATKTACTKLYTYSFTLRKTLQGLLSRWENEYDPPWPVPYFLDNHVSEIAVALTWQEIVEAWSAAPVSGRLFTVLSIDAMRKEIWDEPVSSFALKKGADDWP